MIKTNPTEVASIICIRVKSLPSLKMGHEFLHFPTELVLASQRVLPRGFLQAGRSKRRFFYRPLTELQGLQCLVVLECE